MSQLTHQTVLDALGRIIDPDLKKDIVTLGFIHNLEINGGDVSFRIVLTTPACPVKEQMESQAREIVSNLAGVTSVNVTMDAEVPKGRGAAGSLSRKVREESELGESRLSASPTAASNWRISDSVSLSLNHSAYCK